MEWSEWEPDYYNGEDYGEWMDPEFLPGLPGGPKLPSPGAALSRRLFGAKRKSSARPAPRPLPAPAGVSPAVVVDRIATDLALQHQRFATQQASQQFGPLATSAVAALTVGIKSGNWFEPALISGLPALQLLAASRGTAMSAAFRSNPWTTLGFPVAALLLAAFSDRFADIGKIVVNRPDVSLTSGAGGRRILNPTFRPGVTYRFVRADDEEPANPTKESPELLGPLSLAAADQIKVIAERNGVVSQVVHIGA